jgi:hypothetical protein
MDVEGHNNSGAPILIFAESLTGLEKTIQQDQFRGKCASSSQDGWRDCRRLSQATVPVNRDALLQLCFGFSRQCELVPRKVNRMCHVRSLGLRAT